LADHAFSAPPLKLRRGRVGAGLQRSLPRAQDAPTPEGGERGGDIQNKIRAAAIQKAEVLVRETRATYWTLPLAQQQLRQRTFGALENTDKAPLVLTPLALTPGMKTKLKNALGEAQRRKNRANREATMQSQHGQAPPQVRGGRPCRCMQRGAVAAGCLC